MTARSDSRASAAPARRPQAPPPYRRIVVKAGTTLLTDAAGRLNMGVMETLVRQMAELHRNGVETIFVTSGAVAAGRHVLRVSRGKKDVPFKQVLAAAGQGRLMHTYEQLFSDHGITVAQALLTRKDLDDRLGYLNVRNTLLALLERGVIPIVNENDVVAIDELEGDVFGDNDNLSALVANLVDADLLALLGGVEGLFTADPHIDPGARLISTVERLDEEVEALAGASWSDQGRGGMTTKLEAARLATASGVDVAIAGGLKPEVLTRLAARERIGTFFPTSSSKMESRKRWMLSGPTRGEILVDEGASTALLDRNRSLLPAGVTEVRGAFGRGDIVSILADRRGHIAAGIANYGSDDLAKIKGSRSDRIEQLLGHHYGDEAVHRNNMVVL